MTKALFRLECSDKERWDNVTVDRVSLRFIQPETSHVHETGKIKFLTFKVNIYPGKVILNW